MNVFDIIETGYDRADETINFGTRCMGDGDNLYEACTLASLKCSQVNAFEENGQARTPHICSLVHNGEIYLSMNSLLRIFSNKDTFEVVFEMMFDSIIDVFYPCPDGHILICLRNGSIQLFAASRSVLFRATLCSEEDLYHDQRTVISTFVEDCDSNIQFLIIMRHGSVHRLTIDEKNNDFKLEEIFKFPRPIEVVCFAHPFLLASGEQTFVFDLDNEEIVKMDLTELIKQAFADDHMFIVLQYDGSLVQICCQTLLTFPIPINNSVVYKEMLFLTDHSYKNKQLVAIATDDEYNQCFLQLLNFPDLAVIYSLKVSNNIHIIRSENVNDEILYLEDISRDAVNELRLLIVYETEPLNRLQRLLKRRKFDEAEKFARNWALDIILIHKAKAQIIVDKSVCLHEDVDELIQLLDQIDDVIFKLQCCIDVECCCSDFNDIRRILQYGCSLTSPLDVEDQDGFESLQEIAFRLMYRFDTLTIIDRKKCFNLHGWLSFQTCSVIHMLQKYLTDHRIEEAIILYSRLDETSKTNLSEEDVERILVLLNNIPLNVYKPFLPTFITQTMKYLPWTLPLLSKWAHSNVFRLEEKDKAGFPENAITFIETTLKLLRLRKCNSVYETHNSCNDLNTLLFALRKLQHLKNTYNITIPTAQYLTGPKNVVRTLLAVDMPSEEYNVFLKDYLYVFIIDNQMEPSEIFSEEIKILLEYPEKHWTPKIGLILDCITSLASKLEAIKLILPSSQVPWCDTVRNIGNDALSYSHPIVKEIKEIVDKEPMLIVLRKPKYKIREREIATLNDLKFIIERIIYCNEPTLVEDVYTLCKTATHRHEANMILIRHFIRIGDFDKVLHILDENESEETRDCLQELLICCEGFISSEITIPELRNNYYEVLRIISNRLSKITEVEHEIETYADLLTRLKNVRDLHMHFSLQIPSYKMLNGSFKTELMHNLLQETCNNFNTRHLSFSQVHSTCLNIGKCLNLNTDIVIIEFCKLVKNDDIVLQALKYFLEKDSEPTVLFAMAMLMLRHENQTRPSISRESTQSSFDSFSVPEEEIPDQTVLQRVRLARQAAIKALVHADPDDLDICMEVFKWINVPFQFSVHNANELQKVLFGDLYDCVAVNPECFVSSHINVITKIYADIDHLDHRSRKHLTLYQLEERKEQEPFSMDPKEISMIIEKMNAEGHVMISFRIIKTLYDSLWREETSAIRSTLKNILIEQCVPNVLQTCVSNNTIDCHLIYNLLFLYKRDDAIKFIETSLRLSKRQPKKLKCLAQVGIQYLDLHKITTGRRTMVRSILTVKWWNKFGNKTLNYDNFFKITSEERIELLLNLNFLNMGLIEEYCKDFKLDMKTYYLIFLKKTLCNWQPIYEIIPSLDKSSVIRLTNSEDDLLAKCLEIVQKIDDEGAIRNYLLYTVWNSVNYYYYEVFITISHILTKFNSKLKNDELIMLKFLKNYRRISVPTETEIEQWFTNFPDTGVLDPLSKFRMPYSQSLFTNKILEIISSELNLDTYKFWLHATNVIKVFLNRDEICCYVVKKIISNEIFGATLDRDIWNLTSKHEDMWNKVDECIQNVSDLEKATATIYHLLRRIPSGADQVIVTRLCYKYATMYREANPDKPDVDEVYIRVQKKFYNVSARHILHRYHLAEEKFFTLIPKPQDLISALYMDERILIEEEYIERPDFSKAAEALATLFDLDLQKFQYNLVNNWLLDGHDVDLDCDLFSNSFNLSHRNQNNEISEEDIIKRSVYVCKLMDIKFWQTYLLNIGQDDTSDKQKNLGCRVKALKAFMMISDANVVETLTGLSSEEFLNDIDKLTLLKNMQLLGINIDIHTLYKSSQKSLLNRLSAKGRTTLSIETMALLCMTYSIYDTKYWEVIIDSAIALNMYDELKMYVEFLKNRNCELKDFYKNAWKRLIDNAFKNLKGLPREKRIDVLVNNFLMIQTCPVLFSLNFEQIFRYCLQLGEVSFAAVLLQYISDHRRRDCVKIILSNSTITDIIINLDKLIERGIWGIIQVKTMLSDYNEIEDT